MAYIGSMALKGFRYVLGTWIADFSGLGDCVDDDYKDPAVPIHPTSVGKEGTFIPFIQVDIPREGVQFSPSKRICNFILMEIRELILIDPEVLGGTPVFKGTRVSLESLFDHLEAGVSLDEFLADFPSVSKVQAIAALELAARLLSSKNIIKLYEAAA